MGKIPKVVIDTNVILSAFGWNGKPLKILTLLETNKIQNFISSPIIEELERVIAYKKLNFSYRMQAGIIEFISFYSKLVVPEVTFNLVKIDPQDNKFVECAIKGNVDYIVSGDKHLLMLKKIKKIKVFSVDDFLKTIP
ncbi:MAG: putative toxin-antitoxin system toxin component, PIN family [bacterium]